MRSGNTVKGAVIAYGGRPVDGPARIGSVTAFGLDEALFAKRDKWRTE